jgi:Flp pilus assembly protein TadD
VLSLAVEYYRVRSEDLPNLGVLLLTFAFAVLIAAPCSAQNYSPGVSAVMRHAADLYAHHDLNGATQVLRNGVARYPDSAQLHFMLGNAYLRAQRWLPAAAEYQKSAELRPHHPDTPLNLGYAYYGAGRHSLAVAAWREAVRQSPRDTLPAVSLTLGLYADGDEHGARECMIQTMRLNPGWKRLVSRDFRWSPDMRRDIDKLAIATGEVPDSASQHF